MIFSAAAGSGHQLNEYFRPSSWSNNVITFRYDADSAIGGTNNTPVSVDLKELEIEFK